MKNLRIDSHQHFWKVSRGDYDWMTLEFELINHDFLPDDLQPILNELNIDGTIVVQAAPTLAETKYILSLAEKTPFIFGVVGWIDMLARDAVAMLEELSTNNILRGIRPMLQDIVGDDWVLQDVLIPVFQSLIDLQLTFDALIFPRHLKHIIRLVERFPDLKIVIDHGAKPLIAKNHFEPWAKELALLAEHKNVFCKLSGLVTAAGEGWTKKQMLPYMDHIIQCFGSDRIMWGSDWPVLTLVSHYQDWYRFCGDYVAENKLDATAIFGRTAQKFYNLVS